MAELGNGITIENDVTWEGEDLVLSQNVRVINGGSLTLSNSRYSIEPGVEIFVDSKSAINISNSDLIANDPPGGLEGFGYCDEGNRSGVKIETTTSNKVRVNFWAVEGMKLDGYHVYFEGWTENTEEMSGAEYSIILGSGPIDLWLGLVGPMCDVSLGQIGIYEIDSNEQVIKSEVGPAADFQWRNMMVKGDPGFAISVDGGLIATESEIIGGKISSSGNLTIKDSLLRRSGPILLTSDNSSISLEGSTSFEQSTDDHDIRATIGSEIYWGENVTGTGGLTDKWERIFGSQKLIFDAEFVYYEISGMHGLRNPYWNFSDSDGISYINQGKDRVVEIAWSDDNIWAEENIWTEQAIVSITDYRTAWNPENSGIGDYGGGQFILPWVSEIRISDSVPNISWSELEVIDQDGELAANATIGDSLEVKAVLTNSGSAAAVVAISCFIPSTGSDADISPSYPNAMIGPNSSSEIDFRWRVAEKGNYALSCEILTPTQLVEDTAFGGGESSSSVINWSEEDAEGEGVQFLFPVLIAIIVGMGFFGYFVSSRRQIE
jgi:hypothetical protein